MDGRSESSRLWLRSHPHADDDPAATNIEAVATLERESRQHKSRFDRVIDGVRGWASSPMFLITHLIWFGAWALINVSYPAFDPFPFSFLTLIVSLEAIILSGFVLMAQDRMTKEADRREHLDLQVDLLAEQELTAILNVVSAIAERSGIDVKAEVPEIDRLRARTDVHKLATSLERQLGAKADSGKRKAGVASTRTQ
jgi:uncharacterized membrane protein